MIKWSMCNERDSTLDNGHYLYLTVAPELSNGQEVASNVRNDYLVPYQRRW